MKKKTYRSYQQARKFVHSLKVKNQKEWRLYCKSGKKPDDIPYDLSGVYKNKGWTNWIDFLGSDPKRSRNREFWSFEKARKFAQSLKLNGAQEWEEFAKSKKRPFYIPSSPRRTYKKEWKEF